MTDQSMLEPLAQAGVVAVVRAPDADSAVRGVQALVEGGVHGIEITYSTPDAAAVIAELNRRHGDAILLGAGTVLTGAQAREASDAGARFLVSPGSEGQLAAAMLATGRTVLLGALTPTELMQVLVYGAHAVKVFPASLGGPSYLKALKGPFPDVPLVPTGGVNADNVAGWLEAGAVAVGASSDLCPAADLAAGRWEDLEAKARRYRDALERFRDR
jgi:2-dehydro-3-deoxyphosphogluconate aldolase / (4S)-4-hydroxy-2-oxoglutarate aldolase